MATFYLLAYPGKNRNDCIPTGIFNRMDLKNHLLDEAENERSQTFYVYKYEVNSPSFKKFPDIIIEWDNTVDEDDRIEYVVFQMAKLDNI